MLASPMTLRIPAPLPRPAQAKRKPRSPSRLTLLDLPDGVLVHIFSSLTLTPHILTFSGRSANRSSAALNLALCSRRLLHIFQASLRHVHLDGSENPIFDDDLALAGILRLSSPSLSSLSLKWFDRPTLHPLLSHLLLTPHLFPHLNSLTLHGLPSSIAACTLSAVFTSLAPHLRTLSLVAVPCLALPGPHLADAPLFALAAAAAPLTSLELGGAAVSHTSLAAVWASAGPTLRSVDLHDLSNQTVGDHTLYALAANARHLRALNLTSLPGLTPSGLLHACSSLQNSLEEICVESCDARLSAVSDTSAAAITAACRNLSSVCFSRPPESHAPLSATSVRATAFALGFRLRKLSVYATSGFRDADLAHVAATCPYLESLGLRACTEITGFGVAELATALGPRLRSIDLSGSVRVCDKAVTALGERCGAQLEFAWLAGLPLVTLAGVEALLRGAGTALRDLNVSQTDAFTPVAIARLVRHYCQGRTLECVVIDGGGIGETTWEIERRCGQQRVRCPVFREELERVRDTCVNAVIVLEQDAMVGDEEMSGSEWGEEDWESASVFDAMDVEVR